MTAPHEILRDSLASIADEARTVSDIATAALARGQRMRRDRRIAGAVGAAVALTAVLVATQLVAGGGRPAPPVASGTPTPLVSGGGTDRLTVPDGVTTTTVTDTAPAALAGGWWMYGYGSWALNPARTAYHEFAAEVPRNVMVNAPAGRYTIMQGAAPDGSGDALRFTRTDLNTTDFFDLTVRGNGVYQWSPDGTRVLTTIPAAKDGGTPMRIGIVDVATRRLITHPIDARFDCSTCYLTWTRDGRSVALVIADRSAGEADERVKSVQLFDAATGTPTSTLNVTGAPSGPWSFAPGGRYMVGEVSTATHRYRIFDLATGSSTAFPCDGQWVTVAVLLCGQGTRIYALRPDGTVIALTVLGGGFAHDTSPSAMADPPFVFGPPPGPVAGNPVAGAITESHTVPLAGGWLLTGIGGWVLNRSTGTYHHDAGSVFPAPTGPDAAAIVDDKGSYVAIDFVDGTGGTRYRYEGPFGTNPQWSRDGTYLLSTAKPRSDNPDLTGFIVVHSDGRSWARSVSRKAYPCGVCVFTRGPDSSTVALPILDGDGRVSAVELFDADTGDPVRSLPFAGTPVSWSPDGRHMLGRLGDSGYAVFDMPTGAQTPFPCAGMWVTDDRLLCGLPAGAVTAVETLSPDGAVIATVPVGGALTGGGSASFGRPGS